MSILHLDDIMTFGAIKMTSGGQSYKGYIMWAGALV